MLQQFKAILLTLISLFNNDINLIIESAKKTNLKKEAIEDMKVFLSFCLKNQFLLTAETIDDKYTVYLNARQTAKTTYYEPKPKEIQTSITSDLKTEAVTIEDLIKQNEELKKQLKAKKDKEETGYNSFTYKINEPRIDINTKTGEEEAKGNNISVGMNIRGKYPLVSLFPKEWNYIINNIDKIQIVLQEALNNGLLTMEKQTIEAIRETQKQTSLNLK
jgi:hypothetical protein